jgi:hypothetical protein
VQRALIVIGVLLVVAGLAWPWLGTLPLGRLPGDIFIDRGSFRMYIPITSTLIVSALASVLLWLWRR